MEIYSLNLRIQSECGKIPTRKEDFRAVYKQCFHIIGNFVFVGIIQHLKILEIDFRPRKLIKAHCDPRKIKALKDTFLLELLLSSITTG